MRQRGSNAVGRGARRRGGCLKALLWLLALGACLLALAVAALAWWSLPIVGWQAWQARTGMPTRVGLQASAFPEARVRLGEVVVENPPGYPPAVMLEIRSVELRFDWASLLNPWAPARVIDRLDIEVALLRLARPNQPGPDNLETLSRRLRGWQWLGPGRPVQVRDLRLRLASVDAGDGVLRPAALDRRWKLASDPAAVIADLRATLAPPQAVD